MLGILEIEIVNGLKCPLRPESAYSGCVFLGAREPLPPPPRPPRDQLRPFRSLARPQGASLGQDAATEEAGKSREVLEGSTHATPSFPPLVEEHLPWRVLAPTRQGRLLGLWRLVEERFGSGCGRSQRSSCYGRGRCRRGGLGSSRD